MEQPQRELPFRAAQEAQEQQSSPQLPPSPSRSSTGSSTRSRKSTLTLDLSNLPGLVKPTPPCNTLIFTNLQSRDIFAPDNLQSIRDLISQKARIHAFSPLKSLSRIIVSFYTDEDAIQVRSIWDGEAIMGEHCRVYFGHPTPLTTQPHNLELPDAGKLFFISPPPSPPHGWEQKMEDAPNKMVHADDLADALARLRHHNNNNNNMDGFSGMMASPISPVESGSGPQRSRSSTLVFQPNPQGASPDLPCVIIHDMTDEPEDMSPIGGFSAQKPIMAHTSRPPVELMHDA
ncbi:Calcipressin-domain-containing protein [Chaetomidium leptoderma]|uniref:Calcipressin-domain-containing protein n=1 Tax=Chaetomidium leptoderma TaxID=669021 RepID=A0AAN6VK60_9PEZI|nr:Calcipressin-domain-containing protein [Chaetomidium leptoderma]